MGQAIRCPPKDMRLSYCNWADPATPYFSFLLQSPVHKMRGQTHPSQCTRLLSLFRGSCDPTGWACVAVAFVGCLEACREGAWNVCVVTAKPRREQRGPRAVVFYSNYEPQSPGELLKNKLVEPRSGLLKAPGACICDKLSKMLMLLVLS